MVSCGAGSMDKLVPVSHGTRCAVLGSATPQHIMRGRFVSATLGGAGQMLHAALTHPSGALWLDGAGHNDIEVFEGGIE